MTDIEKQHGTAKRVGTAATATAILLATVAGGTLPANATEPASDDTGVEQVTGKDVNISVQVGGTEAPLTLGDNGYEGVVENYAGIPPTSVTATPSEGGTFTLTGTPNTTEDTSVVGVIKQSGTITYTGKYTPVSEDDEEEPQPIDVTLTVNYAQTVGKEVTLEDGTPFADGWADAPDMTLGNDDHPASNTVTLSNGQKLNVIWDDQTNGRVVDGHWQVTLDGVATGTVNVNENGASHQWAVNVNVTAARTDTWSADINGSQTPFQTAADGSQSITLDQPEAKYPTDMKVTGSNGKTVTLKPSVTGKTIADAGTLGKATVNGTGVYHADPTSTLPRFDATIPFNYTTGSEIGIEGDGGFTRQEDGTYTATAPNVTLSEQNKPSTDTITLTDGNTSNIQWADEPTVVDYEGAKFVVLTGTATGTVTVTDEDSGTSLQQQYEVTVNAVRAQDTSFNDLTIEQTSPDGTKTAIDLDGFSPDTHEYTVTLPNSATGDAYTLNTATGVDATVGNVTLGFGDNASRVMKVTVNGVEYTVTVNFEASDIKADSPAKLDGIYINRTGENTQGQLIDNWNPNRLDYTVTVGLDDPSPYVLPVAPEGVTISAGDVTQTAQSAKQVWTVTDDATGASREYSVTVIRPVETAVTKFTPDAPIAQEQTVQPDSPQDAELASHGYVDKDGNYVPVDTDEYEIPEGGTFSYEAKSGQAATVNVRNTGMTYTYTVTVLPQDTGGFPQQHTFTVTYLTEATHKAELTGIAVDGTLVGGFDPAKHEYSVAVNDPNQWVVSPQYDKTTGMSVTTSKEGADATITVTSGDGLVSVDYKVHVTQKLFGGEGTVGTGGLAQTVIGIGGVLAGLLAMLGIGASAAIARRRTLRNRN